MTLEEIAYICSIASFAILVAVYIIVKPSFRKRSKNTTRRKIKLYVDKIEKSYRGKITELEPKWKNHKNNKINQVELPFSDINDFKNLSDLSNGAENLLSKEEMNSIQELIEAFEKEKYNNPRSQSGEVINFESIYKIADLAKKLQELIREKLSN